MDTLRLPAGIRRALVDLARHDAPRECCGFLLGSGSDVRFVLPMTNVASDPLTRYRIEDREHLSVRRILRSFTPSLEILGVYHSHPQGPARPSERDVREASYPDWVFVIVGLTRARATVAAYRIANGIARKLKLR